MKTLIIEDEEQAISALMAEIQYHCPELEIVGIAQSVKDGAEKIRMLEPELVFLDIQLSDGLGFDLLNLVKDKHFHLIFTTAYSQYAIKAIKFSAIDYLLKPIDGNELREAVKRAIQSSQQDYKKKLETFLQNQLNFGRKKIALPTSDGISIFELESIIRCSSEGNYTCVYFVGGKKMLFAKTLKEFEEMLGQSGFERVHHSHIINLDHLTSYTNKDGGYVILSDKSTVPVSQRKKAQLLAILNNFNG
ncbi:LytR/AlgR family response regulator transcription factor [Flavobacterium sp.]|uniref:LytR/AlgR family response regulator transcription factor n=1 Tax=Flavobacterium sp. TaxID=239 RepID=UPI0039E276C5